MKTFGLPLLSGTIIGFLIWALSEPITGHLEPWDIDKPEIYYLLVLFFGLVLGAVFKHGWWCGAIGLFLGQAVYMTVIMPLLGHPGGPLAIVGLAFLLVLSCGSMLTGAVGSIGIRLGKVIRKKLTLK